MDGLLSVAVPEGGFGEVREIKGSPIPDEDIFANIRATHEFNLPVARKQPFHGGTLIFVCGGPTLLQFIDEIKARKMSGEFIMTSNNTYDFLVSKGIVADACLLMDPKERVKDYVKNPQAETTFYCATVVNPKVIENLLTHKIVKVLIAYGLDKKDIELQHQLYPSIPASSYLIGGTMTPLRAMPLACMLGYGKVEYYGFDSCYGDVGKIPIIKEGEPGYNEALIANGIGYEDKETGTRYIINEPKDGGYFYAYKKKRVEDCIVAEAGDRRFLTSPGFAYQAKQFLLWIDRLDGKLEVVVHGDSLSSYLLKRHLTRRSQLKACIGDRRWTDEYAEMQRKMHAEYSCGYGVNGGSNRDGLNIELATRAIVGLYLRFEKTISVLDYGCGNGDLGEVLSRILRCATVTNYDPFHPLWRDQPEPGIHDFVTCCDVFEHVEEQCVNNTVKYIADRCRYGAYFQIHLTEAVKTLPDGRNAHITQRNSKWWAEQFRSRFDIVEASDSGDSLTLICQKKDIAEIMDSENREAA